MNVFITKIFFLLTLLLTAWAYPVKAQDSITGPCVVFKDGRVLYGNVAGSTVSVFGRAKEVVLDNNLYPASVVSMYRSGAMYGNVRGRFLHADHENKMIVFMKVGAEGTTYNPSTRTSSYHKNRNKFYYALGLTPLKRLNISNLKKDIHDNPEAMRHIRIGMGFRNAAIGSFSLSLASAVYAVFSLRIQTSTDINLYRYAAIGLPSGLLLGCIFNALKRGQTKKAVFAHCGYLMRYYW